MIDYLTQEYKGYTIKLEHDQEAESPREWDNLGVMVCKHKNYNLGDEQLSDYEILDSGDYNYFNSWNDVETYLRKDHDIAIILPLSLYDHSGITMKVGTEHGWDSGVVGFIYVTKDKLRKEFNVKRITQSLITKATEILTSEVKIYAQYLEGDIYGYKIYKTSDGMDELDSCWGYYGTDEAFDQARGVIDYLITDEKKQHEAKLKVQIKHHVPLEKRVL